MESIEKREEDEFPVGTKVRVERGSGLMEEGWEVVGSTPASEGQPARVHVTKDGNEKNPRLEKIREWNR